ncbi:phosphatase PAP2 family protein [Streptomyces sp. NBC_00669]|uniref:phosphatase PAP2 family protein n=1 Tax=unclassified Streptomyces TaxID=2593676 RepID=UPI002E364DA1|nr:phosphatase PAP2 family protein [Streptomyces sp. NBC_00669]
MNAGFDAGLYRWVVRLSQHTPGPLDSVVRLFSDYGVGVFAVLMLWAWWRARGGGDRARMAAVLAVPVVVVLAFLANDIVKSIFTEQRPCQTLHVAPTVEACPALGDWSFPSNHSAIAAASAVALLLADRRLGRIAVPFALLLGASRVWIGVHYPHDVLAGFVLGGVVAWLLMLAVRRLGVRLPTVGVPIRPRGPLRGGRP